MRFRITRYSKYGSISYESDIFTEYTVLFTAVNCLTLPLFHEVGLDEEIEFYLNLDKLTYLPFEKLGYDYLNGKPKKENSNVIAFKYNKIIKILHKEYPVSKKIYDCF